MGAKSQAIVVKQAPTGTTDLAVEETLEQRLYNSQGVKREYLLLRILGVDHNTILKVLGTEDLLQYWKKDKEFAELLKAAKDLGKKHQKEAITLTRQNSRVTMVVMEQLLAKKLLQEVLDEKPVFIKTHLGREVYNRIMNQVDAQSGKGSGAWEELILRRGWNYGEKEQSTSPVIEAEYTTC